MLVEKKTLHRQFVVEMQLLQLLVFLLFVAQNALGGLYGGMHAQLQEKYISTHSIIKITQIVSFLINWSKRGSKGRKLQGGWLKIER